MLSMCSYSQLPLDEEAEIVEDNDDRGMESDESDSAVDVCCLIHFSITVLQSVCVKLLSNISSIFQYTVVLQYRIPVVVHAIL